MHNTDGREQGSALDGTRRRARLCALAAIVTLLLLAPLAAVTKIGWAVEESLGLETLFQVRGPQVAGSSIVIIGISPETSRVLDRPGDLSLWNRDIYADVIGAIRELTAAPIAMDVFFDPARSTPGDLKFANALRAAGNVALVADTSPDPVSVLLPAFAESAVPAPFPIPVHRSRVRNRWRIFPVGPGVPTLANVAATLTLSHDAVVKGESSRSSDAAALRQLLLDAIDGQPVGNHSISTAQTLSGRDQTYYNFYGPPGSFRSVPMETLLANESSAAESVGSARIVLIGRLNTSHVNQEDAYHTVFGGDRINLTAGVELLATAIANELDGSSITPPSAILSAAILAGLGLVCLGLIFFSTRMSVLVGVVVLAVAYYAIAIWVFAERATWLPFATPTLLIFLPAIVLGLAWHYLNQRNDRIRMSRAVETLLPGDHGVTIDSSGKPERGVDSRHQICLATDLEDFTSLAEATDEQELARFTNHYFGSLGRTVETHGGRTMDISGDGTTSYWDIDAPSDAVSQSCKAALKIVANDATFSTHKAIRTRVGLHLGDVAHTGAEVGSRFYYRATGDATNTACRLESLNKQLGTRILISDAVHTHIGVTPNRALGRFQLVGHTHDIAVYEVGVQPESYDDCLYHGLRSLAANDIDKALENFRRGNTAHPEKVFAFYIAVLEGDPRSGLWNAKRGCVDLTRK